MPAIDGSTVEAEAVPDRPAGLIAVAWPLWLSRGTVDIATLTMIYIHPRASG